LPTPTDKGYASAGIGIDVLTKGNNLAPDNHTHHRTINALRAPAERANTRAPGKPLNAAPSTPGASAPSPQLRSSYSNFRNPPGEKTSLFAGPCEWLARIILHKPCNRNSPCATECHTTWQLINRRRHRHAINDRISRSS